MSPVLLGFIPGIQLCSPSRLRKPFYPIFAPSSGDPESEATKTPRLHRIRRPGDVPKREGAYRGEDSRRLFGERLPGLAGRRGYVLGGITGRRDGPQIRCLAEQLGFCVKTCCGQATYPVLCGRAGFCVKSCCEVVRSGFSPHCLPPLPPSRRLKAEDRTLLRCWHVGFHPVYPNFGAVRPCARFFCLFFFCV